MSSHLACCWLTDVSITPEEAAKQLEQKWHFMSRSSEDKILGRYMKTLCGKDTKSILPITGRVILLKFRNEGKADNCESCVDRDAANPKDTV